MISYASPHLHCYLHLYPGAEVARRLLLEELSALSLDVIRGDTGGKNCELKCEVAGVEQAGAAGVECGRSSEAGSSSAARGSLDSLATGQTTQEMASQMATEREAPGGREAVGAATKSRLVEAHISLISCPGLVYISLHVSPIFRPK